MRSSPLAMDLQHSLDLPPELFDQILCQAIVARGRRGIGQQVFRPSDNTGTLRFLTPRIYLVHRIKYEPAGGLAVYCSLAQAAKKAFEN